MELSLALRAAIACLALLPRMAATQTPAPIVVEATSLIHGIDGYEQKRLFVRLTSDGSVQWETAEWQKPNKLHSTKLASELVSAVIQRLDEVDPKAIRAKMGPYNVYKDTSAELVISISTLKWSRRFSVINPWSARSVKPLPGELKVVICEVDRLHARVAEEPVDAMCGDEGAADSQKR